MRSSPATGTNDRLYSGPAQWLQDSQSRFSLAAGLTVADAVHHVPDARTAAPDRTVGGLTIERLSWEQAGNRYDAWCRLAGNSIETNIFNEPEFALSAAQHFPEARRPDFLFVSTTDASGTPGNLVAVFAFEEQHRFGKQIGRLWRPPQMALATPLIDPDFGIAVLDLLEDWLASEYPAMAALLMPAVHANGRFGNLLRDHAELRSLQICEFDRSSRAVLVNGPDAAQRVAERIGRKRNKEFRRLWRRLSERGKLEFVTARSAPEIKSATEYFLSLEALGWKGKRRSALLCDPSLATFSRTISRRLAKQGKIEIDALTLDGVPVAMAIVFRSGKEAYFWKTAFKEDFASYSPGVLLTLAMTSRLVADTETAFVDSCSIPDHPMIDHLWPDRIEMADVLISIQGRSGRRFRLASRIERMRRKLRGIAKSAYHMLKRQR